MLAGTKGIHSLSTTDWRSITVRIRYPSPFCPLFIEIVPQCGKYSDDELISSEVICTLHDYNTHHQSQRPRPCPHMHMLGLIHSIKRFNLKEKEQQRTTIFDVMVKWMQRLNQGWFWRLHSEFCPTNHLTLTRPHSHAQVYCPWKEPSSFQCCPAE